MENLCLQGYRLVPFWQKQAFINDFRLTLWQQENPFDKVAGIHRDEFKSLFGIAAMGKPRKG